MSSGTSQPHAGSLIDTLEETVIALLLGLMTLITFANVIARYIFNSNLLWALEATVFLFAWLGLMGISYGVKVNAHLGVDILVASQSPARRRALTLLAVFASLVFTGLLLYGSWTYWLPFATTQAFYEVNDIPMPGFLQFLSGWLNDGEKYEKLPRFIPYFALPLGMSLLAFRLLQAGWRVYRGEQNLIIVSHEVEEMIEEARKAQASGGEGG
jgi:C4-dicarboxylate transporter, DctQ subunit